ncbi:sigma 54-interacting transcriptional regulator [bacterium]|nr:sigma 54-interacting transcriptional regulator [bacterium]
MIVEKITNKKKVLIGFAGPKLDKKTSEWRPTIEVVNLKEIKFDRVELLYGNRRTKNFTLSLREEVESLHPGIKVNTHLVKIGDPWDFEKVYEGLKEFSINYDFKPDKEEYYIHTTTGTHVVQICLYLFTSSRHFPGMLIQVIPTDDNKKASGKPYSVIDLELARYDLITALFHEEHQGNVEFLKDGIETKSPLYNKMIEELEYVSVRSKHPILLMGATGVGKSKLARRIFELKLGLGQFGKKTNFIAVNCATLRGDTVRSELFGHVKGSFTGATDKHDGHLKKADNGILFLDEIGELPLEVQADLLTALEEKSFLPVGSSDAVFSDFQLIAGTNKDLYRAVREGSFRQDLLARIDLWAYILPDLKSRPEDIEPNIDFELRGFSENKKFVQIRFEPKARKQFLTFSKQKAPWPGNFRDLKKAVIRMCTLSDKGRITEPVVNEEINRLNLSWKKLERGTAQDETAPVDMIRFRELDLFDQIQLEGVIKVCRQFSTAAEAGRALFSRSRSGKNDSDRLSKYLKRFELDWEQVKSL